MSDRIYSAGYVRAILRGGVSVRAEVFVTGESVEWCDTCLLPSAIRYSGFMTNAVTLERVGRFTAVQCTDCGLHRVSAEEVEP